MLICLFRAGEGFPGCFAARLSLQPKSRMSVANDDSSLEYRRKSAGSPHNVSGSSVSTSFCSNNSGSNNNNNNWNNNNHLAEPYIYSFDEVERHADGTVVLR